MTYCAVYRHPRTIQYWTQESPRRASKLVALFCGKGGATVFVGGISVLYTVECVNRLQTISISSTAFGGSRYLGRQEPGPIPGAIAGAACQLHLIVAVRCCSAISDIDDGVQ